MAQSREGIIVEFFEERQDRDYCCVVYSAAGAGGKQCYLIPRDIFQMQRASDSKAERERNGRGADFFNVLDQVEIEFKCDRVIRMNKLVKSLDTRVECDGPVEKNLVLASCVKSPEKPARFWAHLFGLLGAEAVTGRQMMPNVVYRCWVRVGALTRTTAEGGREVQFMCSLDSIADVQMDIEREYVSSAPWNDGVVVDLDAMDDTAEYGSVVRQATNGRHDIDPRSIRSPFPSEGFVVDSRTRTLLCRVAPDERVVAALLSNRDLQETGYPAGAWIRFKMIYVSFTKQFVAQSVKKSNKAPDVCVRENHGAVEFRFDVTRHEEYEHIYTDKRFERIFIVDRSRMLSTKTLAHSTTVWARHTPRTRVGTFEITDIESATVITKPRHVHGTALVLDNNGNSFCADLPPNVSLIVGIHLRSMFPLGSTITFTAAFSADRRKCGILHAKPADSAPFAHLARTYTKRGLMYKVTMKRVQGTSALYAAKLGLIDDPQCIVPRKCSGPVDAWIGFNEADDRESVFRVHSIKEPADKVENAEAVHTQVADPTTINNMMQLVATTTDAIRGILRTAGGVERLQSAGLHERFLELLANHP
ncbi:hypothetical protein AAVH_11689 [Aphelenchoides avenae]|nr:hypothetical protein AAVH_11689 [Aphelenchus avenae]